MAHGHRIEVPPGSLAGRRADQLIALWSHHDALPDDAAPGRLREVVALVIDDRDDVAGACSAVAEAVGLIGGRRFWAYRRFLAPGVPDEVDHQLLVAAYDALGVDRSDDDPVGLCWLVDDHEVMRRNPEAVWPASQMLYAGYLPDGRQARIRYFDGARIA